MSKDTNSAYFTLKSVPGRMGKNKGVLATAALLAALMFAAPASASSFSFQLNFGQGQNGLQFYSQNHLPRPTVTYHNNCMGNTRIKEGLRNQGFTNVRFVDESYRNQPKFTGVWNQWVYSMLIDRCTGNASHVQQLRPAYAFPQIHVQPNRPNRWFNEPRPYGGNSDFLYHRD